MYQYPTSSAVQDLTARLEQLTFEMAHIGGCLQRIADALAPAPTANADQPEEQP